MYLKPYHACMMIVEKDEENEGEETMPAKNASLFYEEGLKMLFFVDHD